YGNYVSVQANHFVICIRRSRRGGCQGGTPEYLGAVSEDESLEENVMRTLLSRDGGLHEEPENVLHRELDDVDRYFAVLKSMAEGNRTQNEIAQGAGINNSSVGYYLDRLDTLQIIERDYPVTADPARSRKGRYKISDPLFRFWFRFVYGRTARYEVYGEDAYTDLIEPELPDFLSGTFEELCQQAVLHEYGDEYRFIEEPGNWWSKGHEIDIVAPNNCETLLVGEAKFRKSDVGYGVFAQLRNEAEMVDWTPSNGGETKYEYALFSRGGFTSSVEEAAVEQENLLLFTVDEVISLLTV
ncbi:MAG: ATP-binding protein, partial [Halobacteria archaeon]